MEIIAQIISVVSMIIMVLSFQQKRNSLLYLFQIIASVGFAVSFFMLGSPTAAVFNLGGLLRCLCFSVRGFKRKIPVLILLEGYFVLMTALTFSGFMSVLLMTAQLVSTFFMWTDDGKRIRIANLFYVSPIWLANNIMVGSIGGILCESFNMISITVSFIRYGVNGFEK